MLELLIFEFMEDPIANWFVVETFFVNRQRWSRNFLTTLNDNENKMVMLSLKLEFEK